jgi:hypothetical protein
MACRVDLGKIALSALLRVESHLLSLTQDPGPEDPATGTKGQQRLVQGWPEEGRRGLVMGHRSFANVRHAEQPMVVLKGPLKGAYA